MAVNVVLSKDQNAKELYEGSILERKLVGPALEKTPLTQYSNILSWSVLTSEYGFTTPEFAHLGFDIVNFVIRGVYVMYDKSQNKEVHLHQNDIGLLRLGRGVRHMEKIFPRSEVLQIWLNSDSKRSEAKKSGIEYKSLANTEKKELLDDQSNLLHFGITESSIEINDFGAGFHTINIQEDSVLSCLVLEGFVEVNNLLLNKGDFFSIDEVSSFRMASLLNSRLFMTTTPRIMQFQTNWSGYSGKIGNI